MNFELLLATSNPHKLQEVRQILSPHGITLYGIHDLNLDPEDVDENGSNYYENALIKATALAKLTNMPIIADDSGIEVEAMDNKPGIHSARYSKECGGHHNAIKNILEKVEETGNRKARFVCNVVLLNTEKEPRLFEGITTGEIASEERGEEGFGYDPIFIPDGYDVSYAELSPAEKNTISHRAKALKKLLTYLKIKGYITK